MKVPFIDLYRGLRPLLPYLETAARSVYQRSWFLRGPETERFEEEWAAYCGQAHCVACANGTDAITLAVMAHETVNWEVPAYTVHCTAEGVQQAGCRVLVEDINDYGQLPRPTARSLAVPLFGQAPSDRELERCRVFDGAHAHGWKPPKTATVAWSFYPTKTLGALGDAGAVTTDDASLAQEMRELASRDDTFRRTGQITTRIDELQAAFLRVKLRMLDMWIEERQEIAQAYYARLPMTVTPVTVSGNYYLYVIASQHRDALAAHLKTCGIETKVHYPTPLHRLPPSGGTLCADGTYPTADLWSQRLLSLPCFPGLDEQEIDYVCSTIAAFEPPHDSR